MFIASARALLALPLLAGPAIAAPGQDHPAYLPTRDVAVTYRLSSDKAGVPKEASVHFSAATHILRLDNSALNGYAVIDRAARKMMVVMTRPHTYAWLPFSDSMANGFILNDSMTFKRTGADSVAGYRCTTWDVVSSAAAGSVCITDDGVLLRGHGRDKHGDDAGLEATAVTYAPQPAALFTPPAGFIEMDLSARPPTAPP